MSSMRHKLKDNINDSKNTRLSFSRYDDFKTDELAHLSRYDAAISKMIKLSKSVGKPLDVAEVGCGDLPILYMFWKNYVVKKTKIINSYTGFDIDGESPVLLGRDNDGRVISKSLKEYNEDWLVNVNKHIPAKQIFTDLTVNSIKDTIYDNSIDFYINMEVLEHVHQEFSLIWIREASEILRKGGIAYFSTPNHDGSRDKLPEDHIYEYGFEELKSEFEKYFNIEQVSGTFVQMPTLKKQVKLESKSGNIRPGGWTLEQLDMMMERYGQKWVRVVAATAYPEISNNCNWVLTKK